MNLHRGIVACLLTLVSLSAQADPHDTTLQVTGGLAASTTIGAWASRHHRTDLLATPNRTNLFSVLLDARDPTPKEVSAIASSLSRRDVIDILYELNPGETRAAALNRLSVEFTALEKETARLRDAGDGLFFHFEMEQIMPDGKKIAFTPAWADQTHNASAYFETLRQKLERLEAVRKELANARGGGKLSPIPKVLTIDLKNTTAQTVKKKVTAELARLKQDGHKVLSVNVLAEGNQRLATKMEKASRAFTLAALATGAMAAVEFFFEPVKDFFEVDARASDRMERPNQASPASSASAPALKAAPAR